MPRVEECEVLARRAREFLVEAEEALGHGRYDLACFFAEQAVQLYLKAVLLRLVGDYPRTHYIRVLLARLLEVLPEEGRQRLEEFVRANRARLSELEDVYVMARYSTKAYGREDAEDLVGMAKEVMRFVEGLVGGGG